MGTGLGPLQHEDSVFGKTSQEVELRGRLLRLTRQTALVQVPDTITPIRVSDTLTELAIQSGSQAAYRGRGTITSLVDAGTCLLCELRLDPAGLVPEYLARLPGPPDAPGHFDRFMEECERELHLHPGFKAAVTEIHATLTRLQRWTEQLELGAATRVDGAGSEWLNTTVDRLAPRLIPALNSLFARYEETVPEIPQEDLPAHRAYVQQLLHPLVLCAPFAHRTYQKPLGYAGDFEMVNMMVLDPRQGTSLFARLFNVWLLSQDSALAHRHRIAWLTERLIDAAAAAVRQGRRARIYNLGCGPAWELQKFLARSPLGSHVDCTLADFEPAALDHARSTLRRVAREHHRQPRFEFVRRSVRDLLREALPATGLLSADAGFDLVYCAGLFDYFASPVCRQILLLGHRSTRPGGTLLCTNVASTSPNRGSMDLILDWHIHYRDAAQMRALVPPQMDDAEVTVLTELTGANIFLQVTKADAR